MTREGGEDRSKIFEYIAGDDPTAALELDDEIEQKTGALPEHSELYRVGRRRGTHEMMLAPNYVLVYRILKRTGIIEIVHIVGARQNYGRRAKARRTEASTRAVTLDARPRQHAISLWADCDCRGRSAPCPSRS